MQLPFPSLQMLRDLPHRVALSAELTQGLERLFAEIPDARAPTEDQRPFFERALRVTEEAIVFLDRETGRLTERRFRGSDPNALRHRALVEPKRQAEQALAGLKQKVNAERTDWQRRLQKQAREVRDGLTRELAGLELERHGESGDSLLRPADAWAEAHEDWARRTFEEWAYHLGELLPNKYAALVRPELDAVGAPLDLKLDMQMPEAPEFRFRPRLHSGAAAVPFVPPSALEAVFETFKNGINTVAMMAGLIVVPVAGSLMNESPVMTRAIVMGTLVVPVLGFAVFAGRRTRHRLAATHEEKARAEITKRLDAAFMDQLERFRADAERGCATYAQMVLDQAIGLVDQAVGQQLARREEHLGAELAAAQLELDRINEQVMIFRQAKGGLVGQLRLDLVRRLEG